MENKIHTTKSLSFEEAKTRELFATVDWTSAGQAIANVFCAFPYMTFTCEKLEAAVAALFNMEIALQPALTRLVKAKVLRSRKHRGQTLYEVNY